MDEDPERHADRCRGCFCWLAQQAAWNSAGRVGAETAARMTVKSAARARHRDNELMPMTLRFEIFPSDLDATVDFYTRVLGFSLIVDRRSEGQPYLTVEREGVRIGAAGRPDQGNREHRRPPTGVELVLEVDDLAAELDRIRTIGWPVAEEAQLRPWGLRDFRIVDPSGYYLRITNR